jgi:beta-glucosidase
VTPRLASLKFGAATSAYQVEGAVDVRGESVWDRFCRLPGAIARGETGDVACEHHARWRDDVELMAALGLEAYRFSIAWARVQPDGRGALDALGVGFYRRLAESLLARGIEPVATLYHSDFPAAVQDRGGWASRDTLERFAEYAAAIAAELGDVIPAWITINEPWGVAFHGHADGSKAPGVRDWRLAVRVSHHLLVAHGLAVRALRANGAATIGISLNLAPVRPAGAAADVEAARRRDGHLNRWFLDALFRGAYPEDVLALYEPFEVEAGDPAIIGEPIDFLGVNYYHPERVRSDPSHQPVGVATQGGWETDPAALRELLARLGREYDAPPIWITENGFPDGSIDDRARVDYLRAHLHALDEALAGGADVRRYFVWSHLDNYEWELGYAIRFGLVHVDYESQRRTPKRSAIWYREFIADVRRER